MFVLIIKYESGLKHLNVYGVQALFAILNFISYFVVFLDFINQSGNVDKDVFLTIVRFNESKTFGFIKELYCTF